jgi:hypothetical protein
MKIRFRDPIAMAFVLALLVAFPPAFGLAADDAASECIRLTADLDERHRIGIEIPVWSLNVDAAGEACEAALATDPENPVLQYGTGLVLWERKDRKGVRLLYNSALQGHLPAERMFGFLLNILAGRPEILGSKESKPFSYMFLQRAADKGDTFSQALIAVSYIEGDIVEQDIERGLAQLKELATAGEPWGHYFLGWEYYIGRHILGTRIWHSSTPKGPPTPNCIPAFGC